MNDPLLAPGEPNPVRLARPLGQSDFLLTADHAGRLIPRALGTLGLGEADLERHIAWDIGIAAVTVALSEALDATAVLQAYSRLVIDCNRAPDHPTSIPTVSESTTIPGNQRLPAIARAARRAAIFDPYHAAIADLVAARRAAGRRTVLVAMHSFTPVFKNIARIVQVGVLYHRETRLARIMLDLLRAEGDLIVGDNEPYAITDTSDYTIPVHGERNGLDHVEVEIRQDLIADAAGQAAWGARMTRLLLAADERLRAMSAADAPDGGLTPAERRDLRRLAGLMIPASAEYGVPGADDEAIFSDIVASLGRDRGAVRAALAMLRAIAGGDFSGLGETAAEAAATALLGREDPAVTALGRAVLQCYYRDDRVMRALGIEPRAPYPQGRTLEQGDWSLLDAVRGRPRLWRDVDGRGR